MPNSYNIYLRRRERDMESIQQLMVAAMMRYNWKGRGAPDRWGSWGPASTANAVTMFWCPVTYVANDEMCSGGGSGGGVKGRGSIIEHCHSEAWTPHPITTTSASLHSLPPPSLPLLSPGIPFLCVIRLLIKAVDVERMNAHCRPYLSLPLCTEPASCTESATQTPRAGWQNRSVSIGVFKE